MNTKWVVKIFSGYRTAQFVFDSVHDAGSFIREAVESNVPYIDKYDKEESKPEFTLEPWYEPEVTAETETTTEESED